MTDEGNHHFRPDLDALLRDQDRGLEDRARLHPGDLGISDPEPASAMTEHRVELMQRFDVVEHGRGTGKLGLAALLRRDLHHQLFALGQELVERRIEGANGNGVALHFFEQAGEVAALHGQQLVERTAVLLDGGTVGLGRCRKFRLDHLLLGRVRVGEFLLEAPQNRHALLALGRRENHGHHVRQPALGEEHVLGPAEANPLGPESERGLRVLRDIRVGAYAQPLHVVGPRKQLRELLVSRRLLGLERAIHDLKNLGWRGRERLEHHLTGRSIDGDHVALADHFVAHRHGFLLRVDGYGRAADHRRLAHLAADHGGVRGHPAGGGKNALSDVHAMDVVWDRFHPDQDHALPFAGPGHRIVRGEHHGPGGSARRRGQPLRRHLRLRPLLGFENWMQELVEGLGLDLHQRLWFGENALLDEVHRDGHRGKAGTLPVTGLQHEEFVLFNGELEVLNVFVVTFEARCDFPELLVRRGHDLLEIANGMRRADARHHVLTLRVLQELAVELARAGGGIAREPDSGRGAVALVSKHHALNIHGGPEVVGDVVELAIGHRARIAPALEHRVASARELLFGILRERLAGLLEHHRLVLLDHRVEMRLGEIHIGLDLGRLLHRVEFVLEQILVDVEDHVRVHLDETPIRVLRETAIAGLRLEA